MAVKSSDGVIYLALVLSALAAVLSAPADSSVTCRKLDWLLTHDAAADAITIAGAIGGSTKLPASR